MSRLHLFIRQPPCDCTYIESIIITGAMVDEGLGFLERIYHNNIKTQLDALPDATCLSTCIRGRHAYLIDDHQPRSSLDMDHLRKQDSGGPYLAV